MLLCAVYIAISDYLEKASIYRVEYTDRVTDIRELDEDKFTELKKAVYERNNDLDSYDKGEKEKSKSSEVKVYNFNAKQVIESSLPDLQESSFSTGSQLFGKLVTSIDTRELSSIYKVILPEGGKSPNGGLIPKNTILLGKASYPGSGSKVFLKFFKGVYPSGKEFPLKAQALSLNGNSPGIKGKHYGVSTNKVISTLGLTMVSGLTDVLAEKKELGASGAVAIESSVENGLYKGLSQAAKLEASRRAAKLNAKKEYVRVRSGIDLLINLTEEFKIE